MFQAFEGVRIGAIATCVPKTVVKNNFFDSLLNGKELRIFEKTVGIYERRWAHHNVTASDLAIKAIKHLIEGENIDKNEIECLVFLSQTPDYKIPFTSNILQHKLGFKKNILCLDINAGCAGFVQGLSTAFSFVKTLKKGKVLLVVAETLSKIVSLEDRSTSMLFGDGAAAILIENTVEGSNVSYFDFYSDGENFEAIQIPDGGCRNKVTLDSLSICSDEKQNKKSRLNLSMDGPKVFDFTLREVAPSIESFLNKCKVEKEEIDYFLLHQSNRFILKQIAALLNIDDSKMLVNIEKYGNTSGVSIPLLLATFSDSLKKSSKHLICGYGSGLNWGSSLLDLSSTNIYETIEY